MTVLVRLFGTLEVVGPGGRLRADEFPSRKAKQVFAVLALAAGEPVSKERLVDQIWGERLPVDPFGAVEQAVSVLRRALRTVSDEPVVLTRGGRYQLDGRRRDRRRRRVRPADRRRCRCPTRRHVRRR